MAADGTLLPNKDLILLFIINGLFLGGRKWQLKKSSKGIFLPTDNQCKPVEVLPVLTTKPID
jgi:hypothetical protein